MFTGIIEQIGIVAGVIRGNNSAKAAISADKIFDDVKVGDSISVDGVCLTVVHTRRNFAEFDISHESLKRSSLADVKIGDRVNLEKALGVTGRLGGHLVTGHIDGVGEIRKIVKVGESTDYFLSIPSALLKYVVVKAPIGIDGISLTVADILDGLLRISVIPLTLKKTTLSMRQVGDKVNIEIDLFSKYVEKHLVGEPRGLTEETMMRAGFLPLNWSDN